MRVIIFSLILALRFPSVNASASESVSPSIRHKCATILHDLGVSTHRILEIATGKLKTQDLAIPAIENAATSMVKAVTGTFFAIMVGYPLDGYIVHLRDSCQIYNWITLHGTNFVLGQTWIVIAGCAVGVILPEFYVKHPRIVRLAIMPLALGYNFYLENHPAYIDWADVASGSLAVAIYPVMDRFHWRLSRRFLAWIIKSENL
jgi:hypothetical protein